jgi:branched-subunit amino acid aminotransferase/4-amino-4-deoxychorismate lyase
MIGRFSSTLLRASPRIHHKGIIKTTASPTRPLAVLVRAITTTTTQVQAPYFCSVNGTPNVNPTVSVFDTSFQRGTGVFEVVRVLPGGMLRAVDLHLDRLERSCEFTKCPLPPRETLQKWLQEAATQGGEGSVRLMATQGAPDGIMGEPSVFIMWQPHPTWPKTISLLPMLAPWHPAGHWDTTKWLSYGPNVRSTSMSVDQGFTDALLLAHALPGAATTHVETCIEHMYVLDGPNFAIGWFCKDKLYFPCWNKLGLLQSTTQVLAAKAAQEILQIPVEEGVYRLSDILQADEAFVMSSTRGIIPVDSIGDTKSFSPPGPSALIPKLQNALDTLVAAMPA